MPTVIYRSGLLTGVYWVIFLLWGSYVHAQIVPKSVEPDRFERRFEKPIVPKSTIIPVEPDTLEPKAPEDLRKVKFILGGVEIEGATVYTKRQLFRVYRRYLKKEVTLAHAYLLAKKLTAKYRNDGYILTQVIVPPQSILEDRVIRLRVIEGYINKISFKGRARGSKRLLKIYRNKILRSRPLNSKVLERYLLLINDLAGVTAKSVLTPSETQPGASDMTILMEHKIVDGHVTADNRGSKFNGPYQFTVGVNANSVLGLYERTGVVATMAHQPEELIYFTAYHEEWLGSEGTRLLVSGSHADTEPGDSLKDFEVKGESTRISLKVSHPFIRSRGENLSAFFGLSLNNSKTNVFKDLTISKDRLRVLDFGASYDFADRYRGVNVVGISMSQGLDIFDARESGETDLSRKFGNSDFTKINGRLLRLQQLAPRWTVLGALEWQYAFNNLLAGEEFGVGGARIGRGYDSSEISGDHGLAGKIEFQYAYEVGEKYFKDFQAYTFFDYGSVWHVSEPDTVLDSDEISSVGGGVRFNATEWLSGYFELAKPLGREVASEGDKGIRFFFSLTGRF